MTTQGDKLERLRCEMVVEGSEGRVYITPKPMKEWSGLDAASLGRLERNMEKWCDGRTMPPELYRNNAYGDSSMGHAIAVFKTHQKRFYGYELHLDNTRTFIVVDCDVAKKQDKVKKASLDRIKKRVDAFERKRSE